MIAAASKADVEKALKKKEYPTLEELRKRLPPELTDIAPLFNRREVEKLAPFRGSDIDYKIEIRE